MSKQIWIEAQEELSTELEREPTDEEMNTAYVDRISSLYEQADLLRKERRENGG